MTSVETAVRSRCEAMFPHLDERARRLLAGAEAATIGYGGIAAVWRATGLSKSVIAEGMRELAAGEVAPPTGVRRPGGGRQRLEEADPSLLADLDALLEPATVGDPERPLRWTSKSTRRLAAELREQGHSVSHDKVADLLEEQGYSLQAARKVLHGKDHPDRDAQFRHVHAAVTAQQTAGEPAISIDAKKKELIGDFKNAGREWHVAGEPVKVQDHDFPGVLGKVTPYGVYDLTRNEGWVNVGTDHDTAAFAVESIRRWWTTMGAERYPTATRLLLTADGGGSNSHRNRAWKVELQKLANDTGLILEVCHFPPGTSKWNKIEHRLFAQVTLNWRGRPLTSHEVIVSLIAATTTTTGLIVKAVLDQGSYPKGVITSDEDLAGVDIRRNEFHGEWNYSIHPLTTKFDNVI